MWVRYIYNKNNTMAKRIRMKESELTNLIRRTIKETQLLNEAPGCPKHPDSCPQGMYCEYSGPYLNGGRGTCLDGPDPHPGNVLGGGRTLSGGKGNDMSRIRAKALSEQVDTPEEWAENIEVPDSVWELKEKETLMKQMEEVHMMTVHLYKKMIQDMNTLN